MNNSKELIVKEYFTIKESLEIIDTGTMRIAIVIDDNNILLGTLNDGDIRRALLNGYTLDTEIKNIYHTTPIVCMINDSKDYIIQKAIKHNTYQIPIVDNNNKLHDVLNLATLLINTNRNNKVILMAGGLGSRLKPLTNNTPKPLLKVGQKPILETIIEKFSDYGFKNIIISVNYKSQMIKDYFGDGSNFGVNIEYLEEDKRLGTAGALSLIKEKINKPFFVMNADLLTNVNFIHLLDYHFSENAIATMCVREYDFQVPYGVVTMDNSKIKSITEKPVHKFFVNAGIYLLSPKILNLIPSETFYDMPTLFENLLKNNENVLSFPIHEYWLDIGKIVDYERANIEYDNVFKDVQ